MFVLSADAAVLSDAITFLWLRWESRIDVLTPAGAMVKSINIPVQIIDLTSLPDGSGFFLAGWAKEGFPDQIWFQPYPEGRLIKFTNDFNQYISVSVTGSGKQLVSVQSHPSSTIFVADVPADLTSKIDWKFSPISKEQSPGYSLSWTADGKLLQTDLAGHLFVSAADGSARTRLLPDELFVSAPAACGKWTVFSRMSEENKGVLYRMNLDTRELQQLTEGPAEYFSGVCTPNGEFVFYTGIGPNGNYIAKIPSYHDQWLSEGFADFAAGLFLEEAVGPHWQKDYLQYWERQRTRVLDKNNYDISPNDAGPLWLGLRAISPRSPQAYQGLTYSKGGYVLLMLRSLMYSDQANGNRDQAFIDMMHDFVESHHDSPASTESFKAIVEKHMTMQMDLQKNGRLDWFFNEWVYGTQVPRYHLKYEVLSREAGKIKVKVEITQSEVDDKFAMLVPVFGDFGKGMIRLGQVPIAGNSTRTVIFNLDREPKKIELNSFKDILAR